ncbi:hypothetical protein B0H15DRAFT_863812, partial [Mycena belliarum]
MGYPSNLLLVAIILFFYCGAGFAFPISLTDTVTSSSSVVLHTTNDPSSTTSNLGVSATPRMKLPPLQPSAASQFVAFFDNPAIVASFVIVIVAVTILAGVLVQVRRDRRQWRPLPPVVMPDMQKTTPRESLSLTRVVFSPDPPPRTDLSDWLGRMACPASRSLNLAGAGLGGLGLRWLGLVPNHSQNVHC